MALCPSVFLSVTSRSSTKTAKRKITQRTPHDGPGTLVFWSQRSPRNSTGVGWVKIGDFRQITGLSRKRYKIDAWFLLKSNRKSYALYRMVTLPMTLSDP